MSELFDLSGRVAVVTGSTHGIGRACAERLAEHGARVVFSSRSVDDCEARAEAVNRRWGADRAIAVPCDVGDAEQVRALVRRTVEHWGRLDVVVGNARTEIPGTSWVERIDPATHDLGARGQRHQQPGPRPGGGARTCEPRAADR